MRGRTIAPWLPLLALAVAQVLHAAPPATAAPRATEGESIGQSPQEVIQQKLQLVHLLLTKSPALERAARSDDVAVKQQAAAARTLYAKANEALSAGKAAEAEKFLDEALRLIVSSSRMAPDPLQVEAEQRTRYAELLEGVRSFQKTHQTICDRLSPANGPAPAIAADLDRIRGLVEQSQPFARAGRYREANKLLAEAHETVVSALNKMLASATLVYDLNFKSAAEEFDYETARYRSYEELIPIAYAELKPSSGAVTLSERYVKESRATRDLAQQQAARGDHRSAIKTLQEATGRLQTALRVVGLVVPE